MVESAQKPERERENVLRRRELESTESRNANNIGATTTSKMVWEKGWREDEENGEVKEESAKKNVRVRRILN